eukprot:CAMPEP_0194032040 /NCGR_PEP_ID=MMETSP0009_2-20130614/5075_1 /TAXON_ID=210454 /ORGANISM="Grammatophora oceanica, Strain CCMP 410" /LENGTH=751 /DNA_ID=CAMNT_0038672361 /DNA_START=117 /DNA_END=2372 /DNA_ORIENTATION=+
MAEEAKERKENKGKQGVAKKAKQFIASCWQLEHALNLDINVESSIRDQLEEVYDSGKGIPCHACDRFGKDRQSDPALACITCNLYDKGKAEQVKGLKKKESWQKGILTTSNPYSCAIRWKLPAKQEELKFAKESNVHEEPSPSRRTRRSLVGFDATAAIASQTMDERWPKLEKVRRAFEDEEFEEEEADKLAKGRVEAKLAKKQAGAKPAKKQAEAKLAKKQEPKKKSTPEKPKKKGTPEPKKKVTPESKKKVSPKAKKSKATKADAVQSKDRGNVKKGNEKEESKKKKASPKSKKRKAPPANEGKIVAKATKPKSPGRKKKDQSKAAASKKTGDNDNPPPAASDTKEPPTKRQKVDGEKKKAPTAAEQTAALSQSVPPGVIPPTPLMAAIMDQSMMMLAAARAPNARGGQSATEGLVGAAARASAAAAPPVPFGVGAPPNRLFALAQQNASMQSQHSAMQSQVINQLHLERNQLLKRCALLEAELRTSQAGNKALMGFNYKLEASMNMLQTQQQATQSRMHQLEQFSDSLSSVDQGVRRILDESFKPGTHKSTKIKAIWGAVERAFGEGGQKDCLDFVSKHYSDVLQKRDNATSSESKDAKRSKDVKQSKIPKQSKDVSQSKDATLSKDVKQSKAPKQLKDVNPSKDATLSKEVKQPKNTKPSKEVKQPKNTKQSKDVKQPKNIKPSKDVKHSKVLEPSKAAGKEASKQSKGATKLSKNGKESPAKTKAPVRKSSNGTHKIHSDTAVPAK